MAPTLAHRVTQPVVATLPLRCRTILRRCGGLFHLQSRFVWTRLLSRVPHHRPQSPTPRLTAAHPLPLWHPGRRRPLHRIPLQLLPPPATTQILGLPKKAVQVPGSSSPAAVRPRKPYQGQIQISPRLSVNPSSPYQVHCIREVRVLLMARQLGMRIPKLCLVTDQQRDSTPIA